MKTNLRVPVICPVAAVFAATAAFAAVTTAPAERPNELVLKTLDAFVEHVAVSSFDPKARTFVSQQWVRRRHAADAGAFLCEALAVVDATFKQALDAYEAGDFVRSRDLTKGLTGSRDPYLSTNARVFEIKSLVESQEIEAASEKLAVAAPSFAEMKRYTVHVPEMHFLLAFCQLQQLRHDDCAKTLQEFLAANPEASTRLRSTAADMLRDLSARQPGDIGEVADLMGYAGRKLALGDAGQVTQERQTEAVALLEKLIEAAEKAEQDNSRCPNCQGKGCKKCSGRDPNSNKPTSPANQSRASAGATRIGEQRRIIARPGDQWGSMRPEERARILQSLQGEFPSRYRQLVKQYFQTLSKEP